VDRLLTGEEHDVITKVYSTSRVPEAKVVELMKTAEDDGGNIPIPEEMIEVTLREAIAGAGALAMRQDTIQSVLTITHKDDLEHSMIPQQRQVVLSFRNGNYWIWVREINRDALQEAIEAHRPVRQGKVRTKYIYNKAEQREISSAKTTKITDHFTTTQRKINTYDIEKSIRVKHTQTHTKHTATTFMTDHFTERQHVVDIPDTRIFDTEEATSSDHGEGTAQSKTKALTNST